jgi:protease II
MTYNPYYNVNAVSVIVTMCCLGNKDKKVLYVFNSDVISFPPNIFYLFG